MPNIWIHVDFYLCSFQVSIVDSTSEYVFVWCINAFGIYMLALYTKHIILFFT